MFFFTTRIAARTFAAKKASYKVIDNGTSATRRWGVQVLVKSPATARSR